MGGGGGGVVRVDGNGELKPFLCEWSSKVFVKIQKKEFFEGGAGSGWGAGGGGGVRSGIGVGEVGIARFGVGG